MDCPMCDGLGMVDAPAGGVKKCPECDTTPSPYFLPLAAWLDPLDDEDRAGYAADAKRRDDARRAEDAAVAAHAATAGPGCRCRWCTVQPRTGG